MSNDCATRAADSKGTIYCGKESLFSVVSLDYCDYKIISLDDRLLVQSLAVLDVHTHLKCILTDSVKTKNLIFIFTESVII